MRFTPLLDMTRSRAMRGFAAAGTLLAGAALAVVVVTQAHAVTGCQVGYAVNQWPGGFTAHLTVTNLGDPLTGWTLEWDFTAAQQVQHGWNGAFTQSGAHVTVKNMSWNANLGSGGKVDPGFNGSWSGSNPAPASFRLNDVICTGSVPTPPTSSPVPASPTHPNPASPSPTRIAPTGNVIDVVERGVTANDSGDDRGRLQEIINGAPAGSTVYFPAGTYIITGSLDVPREINMLGDHGRSIINVQSSTPKFVFVTRKSMNGISFRDLILNNGGIFLEDGPHNDVHITGNVFRNISTNWPGDYDGTFIFSTLGATNTEISDNVFRDSPASFTEMWGAITNFTFNRNYCLDVFECFHTNNGGGTHYAKAEFNDNVMLKLRRMGLEIQVDIDDAHYERNYLAHWTNIGQPENGACAARFGYHCDTMGLSLANSGLRAVVKDNYILGPTRQLGDAEDGGTSFGIELSTGDGSITTNNTIVNMAPAIENGYASGTHTVSGNRMCGSAYATQNGWNDQWRNDPSNTFSDTCTNVSWIAGIPPAPAIPS